MENEPMEVPVPKKGRHRKKHLYNSILRQMEFYFSDSNLAKDRFLAQLLKESPYIDLSTFLRFNKLKKLTQSIEDLQKALGRSELLALSEDKTKVYRKQPVKEKNNTDECTIYVERLKSDATHEWLASIFSEFGKVTYVSLPKYRHSQLVKGFAFVEFDKEAEARTALAFFEGLNLKIPAQIPPEELCSIKTFEKPEEKPQEAGDANGMREEQQEKKVEGEVENKEEGKLEKEEAENVKKRKHSSDESEEKKDKKVKVTEEECKPTAGEKKLLKKENKKKSMFKELGLQVLSKREWKALRNKYLNLQREKMTQLKQHLNRVKFSQKVHETPETVETPQSKPVEFTPGAIVKLTIQEPCSEIKKTKNEIKALSEKIKFVDVHVGACEIFIRFEDAESAKAFSVAQSPFESSVLSGEEEKEYWKKIEEDRVRKFSKKQKPVRGRTKLLRKAEKVLNKHIVFDDGD